MKDDPTRDEFYSSPEAFFPSVRRIFDVLELRADVAVDGKLLFYRAKFRRKAHE